MKVCATCGAEWPDETKFCPNDGSTLRSTAGAEVVGSVIADRYHIQKKLGEGGMGAVYLGEHVKMGRKSAIKVMAQSMTSDPDAIARFNREAANAARINHPHVCAIYDFGETPEGLIYLAMEFIEGEALTELIRREGALPPKRAARIIKQAGDALQAAHDLGIVHRDLKPDNIMITRGRDGWDVVKVVDFGIAKAMSGEEGQKVTKTGLVVGTPEYMSPEQLAGDKLDGRSDIYSLALVLYRMLTGDLPFVAEAAQEMMIKRLTDDPRPLSETRPDIAFPGRLQEVMDRALARMPSERYASAAEFTRDAVQAVGRMSDVAPVDVRAATKLVQIVSGDATAQLPRTRVSTGGGRAVTPDTPAPAATRAVAPGAKKAPVAAIAAVVGVLAVGGAATAVILKGGGTTGTANDPPAATGDTSRPASTSNPSRSGTATRGDTAHTTTPRTDPVTPPRGETGIPVSAAEADQVLTTLLERFSQDANVPTPAGIAAAIRDTALAYYNGAAVSTVDRALAAYVAATAHQSLGNQREALQLARAALQLAPNTRAYRALVDDLSRPPQ